MSVKTPAAPAPARAAARPAVDWKPLFRQHRRWLLPLLPLVVIFWGPVHWAWTTWSAPDSPQAYQPLVPIGAGLLAWMKRKELAALYESSKDAPKGSLWLVYAGCLLLLLSHGTQMVSVSFVGIALLAAGGVLYFYGPAMLRAARVPLLFLLLLIPLPGFMVDRPTQMLQLGSTKMAGQIVYRLHIPCLVDGNTLITEKYTVEVAAACSGVGILLPLLVMTLWLLLMMQGSAGRKVFLLFTAFWIALAMNVLRVVAIALIGQVDAEMAGMLHDANAWLFTALAFYLTYLAARALGIRKLCLPISD